MIDLEKAINIFINEKECFSAEKTVRYYRDNLLYFGEYLERKLDKKQVRLT